MSAPYGPSQPMPPGGWVPGPPGPPIPPPGPQPPPPAGGGSRVPLIIGLAVALVAVVAIAAVAASRGGDSGGGATGETAQDQGSDGGGLTIPEGPPTSAPTTEPEVPPGPLADVDPCEMVTLDQVASLGVSAEPEGYEELGSARTCQWRVRNVTGPMGTDDATLVIAIYDDLATDDMTPPTDWVVTPLPAIGDHEALQKSAGNTCFVALSMTDTAHIETSVTGNPDADMCAVAVEFAGIVEPTLP
jgi:hypothetical protein